MFENIHFIQALRILYSFHFFKAHLAQTSNVYFFHFIFQFENVKKYIAT